MWKQIVLYQKLKFSCSYNHLVKRLSESWPFKYVIKPSFVGQYRLKSVLTYFTCLFNVLKSVGGQCLYFLFLLACSNFLLNAAAGGGKIYLSLFFDFTAIFEASANYLGILVSVLFINSLICAAFNFESIWDFTRTTYYAIYYLHMPAKLLLLGHFMLDGLYRAIYKVIGLSLVVHFVNAPLTKLEIGALALLSFSLTSFVQLLSLMLAILKRKQLKSQHKSAFMHIFLNSPTPVKVTFYGSVIILINLGYFYLYKVGAFPLNLMLNVSYLALALALVALIYLLHFQDYRQIYLNKYAANLNYIQSLNKDLAEDHHEVVGTLKKSEIRQRQEQQTLKSYRDFELCFYKRTRTTLLKRLAFTSILTLVFLGVASLITYGEIDSVKEFRLLLADLTLCLSLATGIGSVLDFIYLKVDLPLCNYRFYRNREVFVQLLKVRGRHWFYFCLVFFIPILLVAFLALKKVASLNLPELASLDGSFYVCAFIQFGLLATVFYLYGIFEYYFKNNFLDLHKSKLDQLFILRRSNYFLPLLIYNLPLHYLTQVALAFLWLGLDIAMLYALRLRFKSLFA